MWFLSIKLFRLFEVGIKLTTTDNKIGTPLPFLYLKKKKTEKFFCSLVFICLQTHFILGSCFQSILTNCFCVHMCVHMCVCCCCVCAFMCAYVLRVYTIVCMHVSLHVCIYVVCVYICVVCVNVYIRVCVCVYPCAPMCFLRAETRTNARLLFCIEL